MQLSMHEGYAPYMESTLQLANSQGVVLPHRSMNSKSVLSGYRASLTLYLPDEDVGAVLGKKGQNLIDIQQVGQE
jgi:RNA-binding protein Nova